MYSFVNSIAIDVTQAVLDEIIIPTDGLKFPIVEVVMVEADPTKISVLFINTFFYLKFYTSYNKNRHQF